MNIIDKIVKDSNLKISNVKLLGNRYYLLDKIASGGFSDIYSAIDIYSEHFESNSNIVIKIPKKEFLSKEDINAFLYNEYKLLKELRLDSIIQVLDFGMETEFPYIVLEKINGNLFSEINFDNIDTKNKNKIYKDLKNTISYIHKKDIIHADISPSNIFLKNDNSVVLFDFSFSFKENEKDIFSLDYSKNQIFNPKYMSPKLLKNIEKPNKQNDLFSLCVVLYEMYENKKLFKITSLELSKICVRKIPMKNIPLIYRFWIKKIINNSK